MEAFTREVSRLFTTSLSHATMLEMSKRLQLEFKPKLQAGTANMLPSFNHAMPTGDETGTFLSLDVGGSTLRVAIVTLSGRRDQRAEQSMEIVSQHSWKIDDNVKRLEGREFFEWIATKIEETLERTDSKMGRNPNLPLDIGLAWSFPIEQTSPRSGNLQPMGKGFNACSGVLGQDLSSLIESACLASSLTVRVRAIVNDSAATLLSRAYLDSSTRLALVLGTGVNAAIYLPVSALGHAKFNRRPSAWCRQASHVVVNTEMSMFGKYVLPTTRWDDHLNATHALPDFQPFEHLVSGRYLGEIFRLVLVEAVQTARLFGGQMPNGMNIPYALDTAIMAVVEADDGPNLLFAKETLTNAFAFSATPSLSDLHFIKHIARCISRRAAAYVAVGVHALWSLREESSPSLSSFPPSSNSSEDSPVSTPTNSDVDDRDRSTSPELCGDPGVVSIGCNGSVFEKYPNFAPVAQGYLDQLAMGQFKRRLVLDNADESALLGAAVAVGIADQQLD